MEIASHQYPSFSDLHGMIPSNVKPSKHDFLLDTRLGKFGNLIQGYFSPKCGYGVELCSLPRNSTKPCSSFQSKTCPFTGTAIEFNNVTKAWKMTEVGN